MQHRKYYGMGRIGKDIFPIPEARNTKQTIEIAFYIFISVS